jgi:hypothetical protein
MYHISAQLVQYFCPKEIKYYGKRDNISLIFNKKGRKPSFFFHIFSKKANTHGQQKKKYGHQGKLF